MNRFRNAEEFSNFAMQYDGELTLRRGEIYENGILIAKMQSNGEV